jgi:alkylated DNA repair dioxygenase AlkB
MQYIKKIILSILNKKTKIIVFFLYIFLKKRIFANTKLRVGFLLFKFIIIFLHNIFMSIEKIQGLSYIPNFITDEMQQTIIKNIYQNEWNTELKRRVQHYGYRYDYKARNIDYSMKIGELPIWITPLAQRLYEEKYMPTIPDQLIINEYEAGQGISHHIDCEPCFENHIISISLESGCVMEFIHTKNKEKIELFLEPKSMILLKDEARYEWTHGIPARKTDIYNNQKKVRTTRISLTFRNIIL